MAEEKRPDRFGPQRLFQSGDAFSGMFRDATLPRGLVLRHDERDHDSGEDHQAGDREE
jgi:hypothetical protein